MSAAVFVGGLARLAAGLCGALICGVALFGEVTHAWLPGASAHIALFMLGALTLVRACKDDAP